MVTRYRTLFREDLRGLSHPPQLRWETLLIYGHRPALGGLSGLLKELETGDVSGRLSLSFLLFPVHRTEDNGSQQTAQLQLQPGHWGPFPEASAQIPKEADHWPTLGVGPNPRPITSSHSAL
jgi:hypothetical protein